MQDRWAESRVKAGAKRREANRRLPCCNKAVTHLLKASKSSCCELLRAAEPARHSNSGLLSGASAGPNACQLARPVSARLQVTFN